MNKLREIVSLMKNVHGLWPTSLLLVALLIGCAKEMPDYTGAWTSEVNGETVTTTIKADGSVRHRRGDKVFFSTWTVDDKGRLLMDEGAVVGELQDGVLVVTENDRSAELRRTEPQVRNE